jgi:NNP family nitrate/nitrite transporter-like MFS transporter
MHHYLNPTSRVGCTVHLAWMALCLCFVTWFSPIVLMPQLQEHLGLGTDMPHWSVAGASLGALLGRMAIGPVCDRWGPRVVYPALLGWCALCCFGMSLVTNCEGYLLAQLGLSLAGAGFVISQSHISRVVFPSRVGTANALVAGWGNAGGPLTHVCLPVWNRLLQFWFPQDLAWRLTFVFLGLILLGMAFCYARFTMKPDSTELTQSSKSLDVQFSVLLQVILLAFVYFATFGVKLAVFASLGRYYARDLGFDCWSAHLSAGLLALTCVIARPLGGYLMDRWARADGSSRGWELLLSFLWLEGICLLAFSSCGQAFAAVVLSLGFSLVVQATEGATFALLPRVVIQRLGAAAGIVAAAGNAGAATSALLLGQTDQLRAGYFWLGFLVLGLATGCHSAVLFLRRRERSRRLELATSKGRKQDLHQAMFTRTDARTAQAPRDGLGLPRTLPQLSVPSRSHAQGREGSSEHRSGQRQARSAVGRPADLQPFSAQEIEPNEGG